MLLLYSTSLILFHITTILSQEPGVNGTTMGVNQGSSFAVTVKKDDFRIVGGTICNNENYAFMVSIRRSLYNHICGASLLNSQWILSAAHCNAWYCSAVIGLRNDNPTDLDSCIVAAIADWKPHPQFRRDELLNDIALGKLANRVDYDSFVRIPIEPITMDRLLSSCGQGALVMGWGAVTSTIVSPTDQLMCVRLPVISTSECERLYEKELKSIEVGVCTYSEAHKDACFGDSGGPLLCGNVQYGVVSWGKDCAVYPGVYTRVDKHLDYIRLTLAGKAWVFSGAGRSSDFLVVSMVFMKVLVLLIFNIIIGLGFLR